VRSDYNLTRIKPLKGTLASNQQQKAGAEDGLHEFNKKLNDSDIYGDFAGGL
jgi:hypothetical protein